jgi:hypothetical protein
MCRALLFKSLRQHPIANSPGAGRLGCSGKSSRD